MSMTGLFVSKKTETYIRQLYAKKEADRRIRILGKRRAVRSAVIMIVSVVIAFPVFVSDHRYQQRPVTDIARNESGGGKKTVTLKAVTGDGYEEDITVDVNERKYSEKELKRFSDTLDDLLWKEILGNNDDPGNIVADLDLKDSIKGFPFEITYRNDRPLLLDGSGGINEERLREEDPDDIGVNVMICATLRYGKYSEDKYSCIVLHRPQKNHDEEVSGMIGDSIRRADEESENDIKQILPHQAGKQTVTFYEESSGRGWIVLLTGAVIAVFLIASNDRKIKDEAEERRQQMDMDHPRILDRYMLYYMAGMNPRAIWAKICDIYESGLCGPKAEKRYAYEEMLEAKKRMDEGLGELAAYDRFAARCDDIRFRSFINLVKQAVIKGNEGINDLFREEAMKARREKTDIIRTRASEAETKMLLPMFMILTDILAIVMIPAFIGMGTG